MNLKNNKILITGGASGIGFGLAQRFLKEGNEVIICGRREEALKEAAAKLPGVVARPYDLSQEDEREELFEWITDVHPDTNVLVNNAGIQHWMDLTDPAFTAKAREEIMINIEAPLHLSHLFTQMKSITTIMNVSSGLAFVPLSKAPVYSATKAFIHSFTLSIRKLLSEKNIEVIEVIPPALNTDLGGKGLHDKFPPVSDFIDAIFTQLAEGKHELTFGFTESVSQAGSEVLGPVFARMNT